MIKKLPQSGDTKRVKKFALFPQTVKGEKRDERYRVWLVNYEQQYIWNDYAGGSWMKQEGERYLITNKIDSI